MKSKLRDFLKKYKLFLIYFLLTFFILSIIFLTYYPGLKTYDGNYQWRQVQSGIINNAHPFFSTYFMYLLSKIHNTTTTVILFQIFLFSFTWGMFCNYNKSENGKKEIIKIIFTIIFCLIPIIGLYSITLWKDILYSYYLFLISVILFKGIKINFKYKIYDFIMLGISLAMVFSYRHNGIIVSIFLLILFIFLFLKNINLKKGIVIVIITFISIISLISIPKKIYIEKTNEISEKSQDVGISTLDGYIIWMMGAHLNDSNIKNKDDLKFLNNILDIEKWKKVYNPYLINSTNLAKGLNQKFAVNNSDKLRNIFIKYTIDNPLTIIKHYLKADALLINPLSIKKAYVYVYNFSDWDNFNFDAMTQSKIPVLQEKYNSLIKTSMSTTLKYFYQPALILYLSIIMAIILSIKIYGKKIWIILLPTFTNTASLLPINLAQDLRYVYINYLTFFMLLLLFIMNLKEILKINNKNQT